LYIKNGFLSRHFSKTSVEGKQRNHHKNSIFCVFHPNKKERDYHVSPNKIKNGDPVALQAAHARRKA
jgi:hypothetical protein